MPEEGGQDELCDALVTEEPSDLVGLYSKGLLLTHIPMSMMGIS